MALGFRWCSNVGCHCASLATGNNSSAYPSQQEGQVSQQVTVCRIFRHDQQLCRLVRQHRGLLNRQAKVCRPQTLPSCQICLIHKHPLLEPRHTTLMFTAADAPAAASTAAGQAWARCSPLLRLAPHARRQQCVVRVGQPGLLRLLGLLQHRDVSSSGCACTIWIHATQQHWLQQLSEVQLAMARA